jgi:hypothetical protein
VIVIDRGEEEGSGSEERTAAYKKFRTVIRA